MDLSYLIGVVSIISGIVFIFSITLQREFSRKYIGRRLLWKIIGGSGIVYVCTLLLMFFNVGK